MKIGKLAITNMIGISTLVIVICLTLTGIAVSLFGSIQNKQLNNSLSRSLDDTDKIIETKIDGYIKQVQAIAQRDDIRSMDWSKQNKILSSEAKRIGYEAFQVGDASGNVKDTKGLSFYDGDKSYFKKTLSGRANLSDVHYDSTHGKMVVNVSAPIYDNNNTIIGVLSAVEDASFTNEITSSIKLDYDGFCFVIDNYGQKMAGVDYNGKSTLENNLRDKEYNPDGPFGQFAAIQSRMIQGDTKIEDFFMSGKEYLISYTTINNGQWHLGIVQDKDQATSTLKKLLRTMSFITVIAIVFGILIAYLLVRKLRPLKALSKSITEIASGKADLTQRITIETKNEIGEVVEGFNTFTEKLQSIMSVMKDSKTTLVNVGDELKLDTANTLNSIQKILKDITDIGNQISNQSDSVAQTASAVNEVSSNIVSLEKMITNQSECVANASSAVEQMIGNIASVNNSMTKMAESFKHLEDQAIDGVKKQDDVSQKIETVGQQSTMLNDANKIIQDIAEQTNLLAMNAAIEAAHAGEAGKGFSVVADEIRKLSETSSEQSATIGIQLKNIQASIEEIIKASEESRIAFVAVSTEIEETDRIVHEVSVAMEEQTIGSKQINESLHSMNSSTSEVTLAVQEMSEGTKAILQEVQNLQDTTLSVKSGMNEMKLGAEDISHSGKDLSSISEKMKNSIGEIGSQVDQFQV